MKSAPIFSQRLLIVWVAAAILIFACSLLLMEHASREGHAGRQETTGANAFSRSAIGHAGVADILRRLGLPVQESESGSLAKLRTGGVLVLAEPRPFEGGDNLRELLEAKTVLLVLPKRRGQPSVTHPGWIEEASLVLPFEAAWALHMLVPDGTVVRQDAVDRWTENDLGPVPALTAPIQLMQSARLRPVVATAQGILLGEFKDRGRRVWVLADPDVIANHGLAHAANADFAVAVITALRGSRGPVIFDETIHGFVTRSSNPWKLLFEYPFVIVTVQTLLVLLLLLWATMGRFGAPEVPPPPLDAGKRGLLENAARLLDFAGHQPIIVRRYVEATLRDTARQFHAPANLREAALIEWLRRVGHARTVTLDVAEIWGRAGGLQDGVRADPSLLAAIARDTHRWKREIIDGPQRHSRPR